MVWTLFLILQGQSGPQPALGAWGTILISFFGMSSLLLNGWLIWRSQTTSVLKDTVSALDTEMKTYKSKSERLEHELSDSQGLVVKLNATIADLNAKTDLSLVMNLLRESLDASRKFERENAQVHSNVASVLERLMTEESDGHQRIFEVLEHTQLAVNELRVEIQEDRIETSEAFLKVNSLLDGLLTRLEVDRSNQKHAGEG